MVRYPYCCVSVRALLVPSDRADNRARRLQQYDEGERLEVGGGEGQWGCVVVRRGRRTKH